MPFIRRRYFSKKNNVYNVESGKIVAGKNAEVKNNKCVKFNKYRPGAPEKSNSTPSSPKYGRRGSHQKLRCNLSKNRPADTAPPEFINRLEENSKKIENIFSKCKTTTSLTGWVEKGHEEVDVAFRTFLEGDESRALPATPADDAERGPKISDPVREPKKSAKDEEYKHIKSALRMMFQGTNFENTIENLDEARLDELKKDEKERSEEMKIQNMVVDMLKMNSDKSKLTETGSRNNKGPAGKRNHFLENVNLAEVTDSSVDSCSRESDDTDEKCWRYTSDVVPSVEDVQESSRGNRSDIGDVRYNQQRRKKRVKKRSVREMDELNRSSSDSESDNISSMGFPERKSTLVPDELEDHEVCYLVDLKYVIIKSHNLWYFPSIHMVVLQKLPQLSDTHFSQVLNKLEKNVFRGFIKYHLALHFI